MPATRTPGKYGRRSPDLSRPSIRLGDVLTGVLPETPADADYLAALHGGWEMLANDVAGNCVAVTWAGVRRLVTTTLVPPGNYPDQDQVWAVYRTQNPDFDPDGSADTNGPGSDADQGMEISVLLKYLTEHGGPDGAKAVCYASVDPTNPAEVKAAIALFGYVWTGIDVTRANEDEFAADEPWDYDSHSSVIGGHSVITGGYGTVTSDTDPALGGDEKFITWAAETSFTDAFWKSQTEECWVVLWPEHLGTEAFEQGIDLAKLADAYRSLTGRELPVPVQPPQPGPAPDPGPASPPSPGGSLAAEAAAIFRRVEASAEHDIARFVRFCRDHGF